MELIDKAAVIAKIDSLISSLRYTEDDEAIQIDILSEVEKFINTLEVREVNKKSETTYRNKIIKVKCISPFDETWEKGKVYTGEKWHHEDLDMDFWDIYYDYGSNPKYVQFSSLKMLEKEFVVLKNDTLEVKEVDLEQPESYFYCKYGGIIPLCSDCKRNHHNSSFKTEEIITWFVPSKSSKYCIDYVQQEQPKLDIEKIIEQTYHDRSVTDTSDIDHVTYENIAKHFFELGLKAAQKGEWIC